MVPKETPIFFNSFVFKVIVSKDELILPSNKLYKLLETNVPLVESVINIFSRSKK